MRVRLAVFAVLVSISISTVSGCWLEPEAPESEAAVVELPSQPLPLEGSPTAYGMLRVANELGLAELDDEVGLDYQAVASILAHRAGADERLGTSDDRYVEDLAQLDALYWLGEENLWTIQRYALGEGWVPEALPVGCDPALAEALAECRRFVAEATAGSGDTAASMDARWSCVEAGDEQWPAAGYFAARGVVSYREPALGYYATLCLQADASLCPLGVAGLAEHALPECVAMEG